MNDFYQILGLDPKASQSEIKRAYREAIKTYHPDLNRSRNATAQTQKITEAYSVLSDAIKKAEYDQIRAFKKARATDASQQQTASGVPPKSSTPPPRESASPRQEKCRCQRCGATDPTLRVVVFTWVISLLIVSFKRGWAVILCRKCQVKYAFLFNCELAFLGIWGFPWGIIWTIQGLWHNLQGGIQPAENNALLLSSLGYQFFSEGRYEEAAIAFQESLKFKRNPDVTQMLSECERKFTPKEKRFADKFVGFDLPTWTYNYAILLAAIVTFACGVRVGAFFLLGGGGLLFSYEGLHRWYSRPRPEKKGASSAKRPGTRPRSKSLKVIYSCVGYAMLIFPFFFLLYGIIKKHGSIQPSNPPSSPPASIVGQKNTDPAQSPGPQKAHASYDIWDKAEYGIGMEYYKETPPDYKNALGAFHDAAGKGYPPAQFMVGQMYDRGQGVAQDYNQALKWYQKAAEQGDAPAQFSLGFMYFNSQGTTQDYSQALKYFLEAVGKGSAPAQFMVGHMYYNGQGITQDYAQAFKWYQKAADQGFAMAQDQLGFMYFNSQGTTQDYSQALKWYEKAADQGYAQAQHGLGGMYLNGRGTPQDYSQALKWYQKAAEQGDAGSQSILGTMYDEGQGTPQDYSQALKWYQKAAEQGQMEAQGILGYMYYNGRGTTQDYNQAMSWYQKAAEQGDANAQAMIGLSYERGRGVIKDELEALAWYDVAVSQGFEKVVNARNNLEKKLGTQNALIAQERAVEILMQIKTKQSAAQNNSTVSPSNSSPISIVDPKNTDPASPIKPLVGGALNNPSVTYNPVPTQPSPSPASVPAPPPPSAPVQQAPAPQPTVDPSSVTEADFQPDTPPTPQPSTTSRSPQQPDQAATTPPPDTTNSGIQDNVTQAKIPDDVKDIASQAGELFKKGQSDPLAYDQAAALYDKMLQKYPQSLYAWSNLGVVRFEQQRFPEAEKALLEAVKINPNDAFAHSVLGIVFYQMGRFNEAIEHLIKATAINPNDARSQNYLGIACSQKGWQDSAEKALQRAIDIDPNYADAHLNLAVIYATHKPPMKELAREHYQRALDLGVPKDAHLEKLIE